MLKNKLVSPDGEVLWTHVESVLKTVTTVHLHEPCKLTPQHVSLGTASQMSVKLAAQVSVVFF